MAKELKILLLTDIPPSKAFSGALFTDQLCSFIPEGSLVSFVVLNPGLKDTKVSEDSEWIPIEYAKKPNDFAVLANIRNFGLPFKILSSALTLVKEIKNSLTQIPGISSRVIKFAKNHEVDRVWCIIQGQSLIRIARKVQKKLNIPFLTQIWDPPDWWLRAHHIDRFTSRSVLKMYGDILRGSQKVAAISDIMEKEYREEFGADTVAVIPSLDKNMAFAPAEDYVDDETLSIGIAGQIYATENWYAMISALDTVNWNIAGREVVIRILGYGMPPLGGHQKRHIEFLGYRSQGEAAEILSKTDLLYMPYWFDPAFMKEARLCFPSKLTTYFLSGRPVFCHAPEYSSPYIFLKENDAALLCNSLDSKIIVRELEKIAKDKQLYAKYARNGYKTFTDQLSLAPLRKSFGEFLGEEL